MPPDVNSDVANFLNLNNSCMVKIRCPTGHDEGLLEIAGTVFYITLTGQLFSNS